MADETGNLDNIFEDVNPTADDEVAEEVVDTNFITIRSAGGMNVVVDNVTEPISVGDAITHSRIGNATDVAFFVDGTPVARDFMVGPGATITMLTLQKGG